MATPKITMALPMKTKHASDTEDFEFHRKIVKFTVVKKAEPDQADRSELASFEEAMLPHLHAAHNLARWLLRNEQDAQDVGTGGVSTCLQIFRGIPRLQRSGLAADDCAKHLLHIAQKESRG